MALRTPRVYLAGAITHCENYGHGWRDFVTDTYTGLEWVNPLDKELHVLTDYQVKYDDLRMLDGCDAMLMMVDTDIHQWGTPQEQYHAHLTGTPVVIVYTGDRGELSAFCTADGDYIATSVEEGVEYLYELLMGEQYEHSGRLQDTAYYSPYEIEVSA